MILTVNYDSKLTQGGGLQSLTYMIKILCKYVTTVMRDY